MLPIQLTTESQSNGKTIHQLWIEINNLLNYSRIEHYEFSQSEHIGTHMDAPSHFSKGAPTIDEIPLAKLTGNGTVSKREMNQNFLYVIAFIILKKEL